MRQLAVMASLVIVLLVGIPTAAHAAPSVQQEDVIFGCGIVTCTTYYSRSATKNILEPAVEGGTIVFTGVMASLCAEGGPQAVVACGSATAVIAGWSFAAINVAAANNQCAAFVTDIVGHVGWFRTDNSGYCVD